MVIFNDRVADVAERYLKKGAKIYVEGSLQTRKWTDQSGQERYTTEVVIGRFNGQLTMLDTRGGGEGGGAGEGGGYRASVRRHSERRPAAAAHARRRPVLGCAEGRRSGRRNPVLSCRQ